MSSKLLPEYRFPAEWEPHRATWLSWPHKESSWPGRLKEVFPSFIAFIKQLTIGERVCMNVNDQAAHAEASNMLLRAGANLDQISFYEHPTNDAWCRDYGPTFLTSSDKKMVLDWKFNAWGGKYEPYEADNAIPTLVAHALELPVISVPYVMEGGSVDFNGDGSLITTRSCLLNKNRNPSMGEADIEQLLYQNYGVNQVIWLNEGIEGDDTDGHVDDVTRFVNCDTVVTATESNREDPNYEVLQGNLRVLESVVLANGRNLSVIELPMPSPVYYGGQRLPASYANFYISNEAVIVPTFSDPKDDLALDILRLAFPTKNVIGIDSLAIIWGLGSFHCLSQQEPMI